MIRRSPVARAASPSVRAVRSVGAALFAAAALLFVPSVPGVAAAAAQQPTASPVRIVVEPAEVEVGWRDTIFLSIRPVDARGRPVQVELRVGATDGVEVIRTPDGRLGLVGEEPGEHSFFASTVVSAGAADTSAPEPVTVRVPVTVGWPPVERIEVTPSAALYRGTRVTHDARVVLVDGRERPGAPLQWSSSDPSVATVDAFGNTRAVATGPVRVSASFGGVTGTAVHDVRSLPAATLELVGGPASPGPRTGGAAAAVDRADRDGVVRTGDVQTFRAVARDVNGRELPDAPVTWSILYEADDSIITTGAPAQIVDGRFVADHPGVHTVVASLGPLSAERSFRVVRRDVVRRVEVVGQGQESRVFTTDFWVFEGLDGRDYALTGSKMGNGVTFVWDVTDPSAIVKTDSIVVDARTVNDVKVSPDGRYAALSREGASNRRNGVVVLDLADPAHPVVASVYDEGLTGGVHNMFATDTHLFALSAGDKYVILDMSDLRAPRYVSEYDHPDSRVHDVWVHDGLAYSAEWGTGVVVVDVGNGRWGGSIENPVFVTNFPLPSGQTHAVFPYHQESTGRFYLVVGDEIVNRRGLAWEGTGPDHRVKFDPVTGKGGYPRATSGYIQFVDFTDPENPEMVARYEVPEYGTHNMWVEDDVLYQAYYEGGVRMVDISGDLMGNLYTQGREIAVFKAHDPVGYIPNSPGAWSVMPWKGNILFSDINSGLWSVKLEERERPIS